MMDIATTLASAPPVSSSKSNTLDPDTIRRTVERLTERHGAEHAGRIRLGVEQVAQRWWPEDGDAEAFASFCETHFLTDLESTFQRLERTLEQVDGHLHEVRRELMAPLETDTGPL